MTNLKLIIPIKSLQTPSANALSNVLSIILFQSLYTILLGMNKYAIE